MPAPSSCEHGVKVYASGTQNDGSLWHGWRCPVPERDGGCTREQNRVEFHDEPSKENK